MFDYDIMIMIPCVKRKFKRTMTSSCAFMVYDSLTAIVSGLLEAKRDHVSHEQFLPVKCENRKIACEKLLGL